MQIHATNIQGIGACQVIISFLNSCSKMGQLDYSKVYLPTSGYLSNYKPHNGIVKRYERKLPNGISRVIECIFSKFIFSNESTIVLGDIPLRGICNQIVLVHQSNLIYPKINSYSSKGLNFRISRLLFSMNHKYAKKIIVQTGAMAQDLIQSYPKIKEKVIVSPQPVPYWLNTNIKNVNRDSDKQKIILFYPAAYYPHKMHKFLISINNYLKDNSIDFSNVEVWLTLSDKDFASFQSIKFLKNLGKLSPEDMNYYYKKADALLFLSSMESYGLPLIEAVTLHLPILTVDFSYSRWVCEDQAYYFVPYSEVSFLKAVLSLTNDYKLSKTPDYSQVLKKFPNSWDEVVKTFID